MNAVPSRRSDRRLTIALLSFAALAFGSPGLALAHDDDPMAGMSGMSGGATPFGQSGKADEVDRTVTISVGDITFSPSTVRVKQGQTIRFIIKNTSPIDHDFTLGDTATQITHRREMAEAAEKGVPIHHHNGGNAVAVAAGETHTLIWRFDTTGTVEYDCNVPGHTVAGMIGTVVVAP